MKKSKYQKYCHCFFVYSSSICILVQLLVEYGNYSNKRSIQRCGSYQRGSLIRGRRLFQCGHPKVRRLLQGGAYLRLGTYLRKYAKLQLNLLPFFFFALFRLDSSVRNSETINAFNSNSCFSFVRQKIAFLTERLKLITRSPLNSVT